MQISIRGIGRIGRIHALLPRRAFIVLLVSAQRAAAAVPPNLHDRHVFFENSTGQEDSYYRSDASVVAPSELEIKRGKVPVEAGHFKSPPNCLRLKWRSGPGGDWHVRLKAAEVFARNPQLDGDTLSLWCYATEELKPDDAPRIFLQDARDAGVTTISLLTGRDARCRPANGRKCGCRLLVVLRTILAERRNARFNARRVASITLLQNLEDNTEHTLFIDDISIIDGKAPKREVPEAPTKLTVVGYDRHFDLAWQPSKSGDLISYPTPSFVGWYEIRARGNAASLVLPV